MSRVFVTSDHHFDHANILKFTGVDGKYFRNFSSVEEMNETMVERWNRVVAKDDKVYHLGDVTMRTDSKALDVMERLNGRKVLIRGNHDKCKLSHYAKHFKDVRATHLIKACGVNVLLSHVPVHPSALGRGWINIHGHRHEKESLGFPYYNVSVEQTNYYPIELFYYAQMAFVEIYE